MDPSLHTHVVILAGGGGTRLWPLSRRRRPKQFLPLLPGGETLLGATARRAAALCPRERTLVVTAADQVAAVRRCLPDLPLDNIVVEPLGRNTAPCIGLAALHVLRRDPAGLMLVLPSDHHVTEEAAFRATAERAVAAAAAGHVVAIGVRPTRPETGYGYIQLGPETGVGTYLGEAFVEKPDAAQAMAYLRAGSYLWNAGIFFFPARRMLDEIRCHLPALGALLDELLAHPGRTAVRYPEAPSISIDYAVMEHLGRARAGDARALRVVPGDFGWNDVGSFAALCDLHRADGAGNQVIAQGPAPLLFEVQRTLVVSAGEAPRLVAAAHVEDLIIVVTEDAVLVLPRERAQDVRQLVALAQTSGDVWRDYL